MIILAIALLTLCIIASGTNTTGMENYASLEADKFIVSPVDKTDGSITYWIEAKNTGEILLKNVTVRDTLPPGLVYLDSKYLNSSEILLLRSLEYNRDGTIKNISWQVGDLNTGQEKWIELKVTKAADDVDVLRNNIQAKGEAFQTPIKSADLRSAQFAKIEVEDRLVGIKNIENHIVASYIIKIRNAMDMSIKKIEIETILPPKAIYLKSTYKTERGNNLFNIKPEVKIGATDNTNYVTWKVDEMAANEVVMIELAIELGELNPLENRAKASGSIENIKIYSNMIYAGDYRF
jgi:uncharacterized repeat protein (TIGR01451 family)